MYSTVIYSPCIMQAATQLIDDVVKRTKRRTDCSYSIHVGKNIFVIKSDEAVKKQLESFITKNIESIIGTNFTIKFNVEFPNVEYSYEKFL